MNNRFKANLKRNINNDCQRENIIPLLDVIIHLNKDEQNNRFADVYLVMEKMDSNLQKIIASKQELSDEHYQFILYQM